MNTMNPICTNTGGSPGDRSANQHAMSVTTMISASRISPINLNLFTSEEWDRPCFGGGSSANTLTSGTQDPSKEYALDRTLPVDESAEFARVEKLVQAEKEIEALKEQNIVLQNRVANLKSEVTQVTVWSQNLQTYLFDYSSWARDAMGEVISHISDDWVMDGEVE
ncbi:uncharacterized protein H6S33_004124 [Morchella sextelata]|uniref:uncharacterized protein n=1 Tax=Morchella sextelata TaxID=1174677 RepID=UPI001D05BFA4|nr:uncharacterized protein H6S33_004124 [Morchella sextelata]KAH0606463.1 hypothetical protein H6S33_004124 [Morchella sextelata]